MSGKPGEQSQPLLIRVKAVPGASRDAIAGILGDRVKVRVSAAPEGGKANKAIIRLLAKSLGVSASRIELLSGHTNPEKLFAIGSLSPGEASAALGFSVEPAVQR